MKRPQPTPTDPALTRYDHESAFPAKVARAKDQLAKTNLPKLSQLLEQPQQAPA